MEIKESAKFANPNIYVDGEDLTSIFAKILSVMTNISSYMAALRTGHPFHFRRKTL